MTSHRLGVAFLAVCSASSHAAERFAGDAVPRGGGALLYREVHLIDGSRQVVSYQCPDGKPFARKELQAHGDLDRPDVVYEDARRGFRESVRGVGDGVQIQVSRQGAADTTKTIAVPKGAVIDAGFDPYIRNHWDALGSGVSVPFLVASRFRFFDVKILGAAGSGGQRQLTMKLDTWYAFAAPTIQMTYDAADKRLRRYEGMGTVRNDRGKSIDVRIDFPDSGYAKDVPSSALDEALKAPLDGRCAT